MICGSRRVATSRPAFKFTRSEPGRTTLRQACPPTTAEAANGSPRFEPNWRTPCAQTRSLPPSMLAPFSMPNLTDAGGPGLSLGSRLQRRQSWTGRPPVTGQPCAPSHPQCHRVSSFQDPSRVSKRNKFRSPWFCRDAQRRADKLGRHARYTPFSLPHCFCQGFFRNITAQQALSSLSGRYQSQTGWGSRSLPPGPSSTRLPRD